MTQPNTNNLQMQYDMMISVVPKNIYDTLLLENQQLKIEYNNILSNNQKLNTEIDNMRIQHIKLSDDIKHKEIEILRSENELLRKEISLLKSHITDLESHITDLESHVMDLKNRNIVSSIKIAINDLDNDTKNRIDPKYCFALNDAHHDRIIDCHYFDKRYSENARKYGNFIFGSVVDLMVKV